MTNPRTLVEKIWDDHVVSQDEGAPAVLAIDLHLVHEVTSPQAFTGLRTRGIGVRRPDKTVATADHGTPTTPRGLPIMDMQAATQISQLETNCRDFGIPLHAFGSDTQGIVHVIGPELGLTQPGMTIVCGDSHTATHGAFGALAFGIGTSEVEMVLSTQTLLQRRPKTYEVRVDGRLSAGVSAKDIILALIARIGIGGGTGHVFEFRGEGIRALNMEQRMTICNMSIEGGARAGLVAPDDTTFEYLHGRRHAPQGADWDAARGPLARRSRRTTARRSTSRSSSMRRRSSRWSPRATTRAWACRSRAASPAPRRPRTTRPAAAWSARSSTWRCTPGDPIAGHPVDVVFIGSCTNSRISDLRLAASVLKDRHAADNVRLMIVPGSQQVKAQAEREGLDEIFRAAGAEWRESGCSMCIAMNGDQLTPGPVRDQHLEPQLRGPPGQGRPDVPRQPAHGGRLGDRGRGHRPADAPGRRVARHRRRGVLRWARASAPSAAGSSRGRRRTSTRTRSSRPATSRSPTRRASRTRCSATGGSRRTGP